jgi:hypothetical protein
VDCDAFGLTANVSGIKVPGDPLTGVEYGHINVASCPQVIAMEFCHLGSYMELMMHLPAIVTIIVSLPLDEVLKAIVPHLTV